MREAPRNSPRRGGPGGIVGGVLLLLVLAVVGCGGSREQGGGARMLADVATLTEGYGPRPAGSAAAAAAAEWLTAQVSALGLAVETFPVGERDMPAIEVGGSALLPPRHVSFSDATLLVRLPATTEAPDRPILIMAHYDTVADSPGAVDNAGSCAVALALVRRLAEETRPREVMIAFTAVEEIRLAGAHALSEGLDARGLPRPALAISMDLVGLAGGTLTLNGLSPLVGAPWLRRIADAAHESGVHLDAPLPHQVVSRLLPQIERSDHGVFTARGETAFHLYHRPPGRIYLQYHRAMDTVDLVDGARLAEAAALLAALATQPEPYPTAPGQRAVWLAGLVVPGWVMAGLAVALFGVVVLAFVRRRPRGPGGIGVPVTLGILLVAWVVAWAVERGIVAWTDHRAPWLHAPGCHVIAMLCVATTVVVLLARPLARRVETGAGGVTRGGRHALTGAAIAAGVGLGLLAAGVVELAWLPMLSAAGLAVVSRDPPPAATGVALAVAAAPLWLILAPGFIREATFNGFFPPWIPLSLFVGMVTLPVSLGAFEALGRARLPVSAGTALPIALSALALVSCAVASAAPPCTEEAFVAAKGLACEILGPP